jgi:hypothetical protein
MGRDCSPGFCLRVAAQRALDRGPSHVFSRIFSANKRLPREGDKYVVTRSLLVSGSPVFAGLAVHVLLRAPKRITKKLKTQGVLDGRVTHGGRKTLQANVLGAGPNFASRSSSESSPADREQIKPAKKEAW